MHILIADNDFSAAKVLGALLKECLPDVTVDVTHYALSALNSAYGKRPDVAILDLDMPGMNDQQLAVKLLQHFKDNEPRLIA